MSTTICKSWEKQVLENTQKLERLNVEEIQADVSSLNQQMARTLKTPVSAPARTQLVGVDRANDQAMINLGEGLVYANNTLSAEGGIKFEQIYNGTKPDRFGCPVIVYAENYSGESGCWITAIPNSIPGNIDILNNVAYPGFTGESFTLSISEGDWDEETGGYPKTFSFSASVCYIAYLPI